MEKEKHDIKSICIELARKYNVDTIGVFGSKARGDDNEYSDYDIFIIGDINLSEELNLEAELEAILKVSVDLIKLTNETDKFLAKNIMNEGIVFSDRNNVFKEFYNDINNFFIENSDFMYFRKRDLLEK